MASKKEDWTNERRNKLKLAHLGKKHSSEHIKKFSDSRMGHIVTPETRRKIGEKNKGNIPWNKGLKGIHLTPKTEFKKGHKHSKETLLKMSELGRKNAKTGNNSHKWKGGVSTVYESIRKNSRYSEWRKKVFIRDNFKCQECNQVGGYIEAHHINPIRKIVKEKNINSINKAIKCMELWDVNNGITLCINCHKIIDKYRN